MFVKLGLWLSIPKEFTFPPHISILPYCCPFMIKYWRCVSISTWSWRQNQNYESIYSSWINVWWFFCHSIDKVQCKQAHCRCVCILETERTGSSECHLFVIQTKMNLIVREHHFKQNFILNKISKVLFCFALELCLSDEADWGQMWTETLLHGILAHFNLANSATFRLNPAKLIKCNKIKCRWI